MENVICEDIKCTLKIWILVIIYKIPLFIVQINKPEGTQ